ncbi:MAG TPA: NAD(P)-dependent oxidoreductase [Syntrophorhabdales bacterium]|nr:NAD(P)-dependent oxidoreductase [Syntrophorhabdales bacterium]
MKVLVTGGSGYVGGAVTDILGDSGHEVRVLDALLYEECYRKPGNFVYGDVRDHGLLLQQLKWADAVIWLAALVGDGACALHPDVTLQINQESVKFLAEHFDGRIVFLSTCSVYGAQDGELDEESLLNPLSVYAATKLAAEGYLKRKNAIIFRLGTLFGVGDLFSRLRLDLVVNTLTVRAYQDGQITVYGGNQFRPLLHVRDAAQACVDHLTTTHTGIFNLHRQNVRIIDLAYQVRNHFPDMVIQPVDIKFQDARNYRVTSRKAQETLGFKPRYLIDDGIEEIKELLITHRLKTVDNPRYTNQAFLSMFNTHSLYGGGANEKTE